jgi:CBS domain-containing protein
MLLREIVCVKGTQVRSIGPTASCHDAVTELVRHNIGSLLVREVGDSPVLGIITERDILRAQATHRESLEKLRVDVVMTRALITADVEDDIRVAMRLMTTHRIRHLPVIHEQTLFGIVSIGDIVKAHHDQLEVENHYMRSYIQGEGAEVATR